jgi:drug/metabolite transporter (DMT)-like permease
MTGAPAEAAHAHGPTAGERPLPRVAELGVSALVLVIAAGIYLASLAQRHPSMVPPIVLLAVAAVVVAVTAVLLARVREFAWRKFRLVFGWALLEYAVIAGMLVFVFVRDHTPGGTLALFICALVIFAVDIPMMFGFSVARYQPPD